MIEEGPSTSAANQNPHVGNVQNSSYASNTTAAIDRDVEYEVVSPSSELAQESLHAESNPQVNFILFFYYFLTKNIIEIIW
ncbi:unnamed protein product [Meloidogyne enterolobii]|uniref:Uncharacterized protein n=1 Tax=Meloidogyne enterolobii TaxID=390850 RepID=A0ACB0ZVR0_MELEN